MNIMAGGKVPARQVRARHLLLILLATAAILLVPLAAMQFTAEVRWTGGDFIVAGALLAGTGIIVELAMNTARTRRTRVIAAAVIGLAFLFIWAELAVGIVGSPFAGS
jgi:hypothetical protein